MFLGNVLILNVEALRAWVGPLPPWLCSSHALSWMILELAGVITVIQFLVLKLFIAVFWKNVGLVGEKFLHAFLSINTGFLCGINQS